MSQRFLGAMVFCVAKPDGSEDVENLDATARSSDMKVCLLFRVACLIVLLKKMAAQEVFDGITSGGAVEAAYLEFLPPPLVRGLVGQTF